MSEHDEFVRQVLLRLEHYYPAFLEESGMKESTLTRLSFYTTVIQTIRESPIPDSAAQRIILVKLESLRIVYSNDLARELLEGKDKTE